MKSASTARKLPVKSDHTEDNLAKTDSTPQSKTSGWEIELKSLLDHEVRYGNPTFDPSGWNRAIAFIKQLLESQRKATLAEVREKIKTSMFYNLSRSGNDALVLVNHLKPILDDLETNPTSEEGK